MTTSADTLMSYLRDTNALLLEKARTAKARKAAAIDTDDHAYQNGRVFSYYEVISLLRDQALAFGIDPAEIDLGAVDLERDILS